MATYLLGNHQFIKSLINTGSSSKDLVTTNEQLKRLSQSNDEIVSMGYRYLFRSSVPIWSDQYWLEMWFGTYSKKDLFWQDPSACGTTSAAIMQMNPFNQKYYVDISSIEQLYDELQNDEPGCFRIAVDFGSHHITSRYGTATRVCTDHAFIIIKYVWHDKSVCYTSYQLVQSYVCTYTLKHNLKYNPMYFSSFEQLNRKVLNPLKSLLLGEHYVLGPEFIRIWKNITGIKLLGSSIPTDVTHSFPVKPYFDAKRTTNKIPIVKLLETLILASGLIFVAFKVAKNNKLI